MLGSDKGSANGSVRHYSRESEIVLRGVLASGTDKESANGSVRQKFHVCPAQPMLTVSLCSLVFPFFSFFLLLF